MLGPAPALALVAAASTPNLAPPRLTANPFLSARSEHAQFTGGCERVDSRVEESHYRIPKTIPPRFRPSRPEQ